MTSSDRTIESFTSDWAELQPHHRRGALFLVEAGLDPVAVAQAMATDSVEEVRGLLEAGRLRRPAMEELARWDAAPAAHRFQFGIVQPFVVARHIEETPEANGGARTVS